MLADALNWTQDPQCLSEARCLVMFVCLIRLRWAKAR